MGPGERIIRMTIASQSHRHAHGSKHARVVARPELGEVELVDRAAVVGVQIRNVGGVADAAVVSGAEGGEVQLVIGAAIAARPSRRRRRRNAQQREAARLGNGSGENEPVGGIQPRPLMKAALMVAPVVASYSPMVLAAAVRDEQVVVVVQRRETSDRSSR